MSESQLPPPPPLAPPGYGAPVGEVRGSLRNVGGLAKAIPILLAVVALGQLVTILGTGRFTDAAEEFLRSERTEADAEAFRDELAVNVLVTSAAGAAQIAVVVVSIIWLYRIAANHRALWRQVTWAPGWAIAGWVLPPGIFVIPLLMLRESWKAADPAVPPGSPEWKQRGGENAWLWAWFLLFSVAQTVLSILGANPAGGLFGDAETLADYFDDQRTLIPLQGVVSLLAALAWAMTVRTITARHTRLTGETAAAGAFAR